MEKSKEEKIELEKKELLGIREGEHDERWKGRNRILFPQKRSRTKKFILALILCIFIFSGALVRGQDLKNEESKNVIFSISAANYPLDWSTIESYSNGAWFIEHVNLEGFGDIMKEEGFEKALDKFKDKLYLAIRILKPKAIIVASKGLGIVTHLAEKGIYTGSVVLLSPIPNKCDHVFGDTWEEQWKSSMIVLKNNIREDQFVGIGIGTSKDEQSLISDIMDETQVCGNSVRKNDASRVLFEHCPKWFIRSFPGDHRWKNLQHNAINVASLINEVLGINNQLLEEYDSEL